MTSGLEIEHLRKKFGGDEIHAWTEYREITHGVQSRVVFTSLYDANPLIRATNDAAGSDRGEQRSFSTKQVTQTNVALSMFRDTIMKSVNNSSKAAKKKYHSSFNLPKKLTAATNVARSGKIKFREELEEVCSKAKKVQKQSHVGANKFPNVCIESNSRVCLGIKSTKRILSPSPQLLGNYFHSRDLIESLFRFVSVSSISDGLNCN